MHRLLFPKQDVALPIKPVVGLWARMRGFSGQTSSGGYGLLFFIPRGRDPAVWMRGMRFAIDMVWILESEIVKILESVAPPRRRVLSLLIPYCLPRYTAGREVDRFLEVEGGFCQRHAIRVGDQVIYEEG